MTMFRMIWKIEQHKTLPWFVGVLLAMAGYILWNPKTLGTNSFWAVLLGGVLGSVLAARLFLDKEGTGSFVFSRPFSRTRIFWYRWLIGIVFQAVALLIIAALLALGAREGIQRSVYNSAFYPMVRYYELSVLWPVAISSLLLYQVVAFITLRNRLVCAMRGGRRRWPRIGVVVLIAIIALLFFGRGIFVTVSHDVAPNPFGISLGGLAILYLIALTVMTTLSCVQCHRNIEIEA